MQRDSNYEKNDQAFRQLKPEIDAKYPRGHFVAMDNGNIVADAPTYDELTTVLAAVGMDRTDIFVAQADEDYPQYADILFAQSRE